MQTKHVNHTNRKSSYRSASEQPDRCLADRGECWAHAVGIVVFTTEALQNGLPARVPLAVCEKHYRNLELAVRQGATIIRTLERYNE